MTKPKHSQKDHGKAKRPSQPPSRTPAPKKEAKVKREPPKEPIVFKKASASSKPAASSSKHAPNNSKDKGSKVHPQPHAKAGSHKTAPAPHKGTASAPTKSLASAKTAAHSSAKPQAKVEVKKAIETKTQKPVQNTVSPKSGKEKEKEQAPIQKEAKEKAKAAKLQPAKKATKEVEEDDLVGETVDFEGDELKEYAADLAVSEELDTVEGEEDKDIAIEPGPSTEVDKDVQAVLEGKKTNPSDEVYLTDADGRRYCRVRDCDQAARVESYCRYHYLLLWKKIQVRKKILQDGKLERYVEELTSRYPDKFLEVIRRDLKTEKDFLSAIQEMEIDESAGDNDFEDESANYIEEVRGATEERISDDDEF